MDRRMAKRCKKCEHYCNGMCFRKSDDVKIVKENDTCVWEKKNDER